ncbi:PREDICTED: uncharacterized protein LOC109238512 isoform X1 [Nicotiana attenuata]|uniref:uncharacterized protein LOC109238512 isoform X1 n=1 Tax=Nicotiana attenuata TaxID=49451 RepID=UPI000905B8D3|nr:PREDICTED: uncharacterized protein LOC109238512 isoform X1 [Nicotiana attenuata]
MDFEPICWELSSLLSILLGLRDKREPKPIREVYGTFRCTKLYLRKMHLVMELHYFLRFVTSDRDAENIKIKVILLIVGLEAEFDVFNLDIRLSNTIWREQILNK